MNKLSNTKAVLFLECYFLSLKISELFQVVLDIAS